MFRELINLSVYCMLSAGLSVPTMGQPAQAEGPTRTGVSAGKQSEPAPATPKASTGIDALQVAASVQAFYDQTRDVSARFKQVYVHRLYNRTDRSAGKVVFKKPGKMRWDYDKPNGKVIVADGKRVLVFEPGMGDEPDQVLEQKMEAHQLPQAMAFLMGTGRLESDFTFRLLDAKKHGFESGFVLELKPKKPTPHYAHIIFYVEGRAAVRGLVRRLVVVDSNGNRNQFDFSELRFNTKVPETPFAWQPPPTARRVKM